MQIRSGLRLEVAERDRRGVRHGLHGEPIVVGRRLIAATFDGERVVTVERERLDVDVAADTAEEDLSAKGIEQSPVGITGSELLAVEEEAVARVHGESIQVGLVAGIELPRECRPDRDR